MKTVFNDPIEYSLLLNGENLSVNSLIGKHIQLQHTGAIFCSSCGTKIKKTFQDGLCFKCFQSAPEASECILRPELCRAHLGEGRDIEWEQNNHNQPHVVYLAASDTVKVGVTRATQVPFRWMDQGAISAIRLAETPNRYEAGKLEVALKSFFTDKTNWQRMLKNEIDEYIRTGDKQKFEDVLVWAKDNHPYQDENQNYIVRLTLSQEIPTQSEGTTTVLNGILDELV